MFTPFEKVFLTFGPIKLHYYGLMYVFGIIFCFILMKKLFKDKNIYVSKNQFENIFFTTTVSALIGGRLFYILFYNLNFYLSHPIKILAVWEGGMASHGGIIGAVLGGYFMAKKYKIDFLKGADLFVIPLGIALMFGRFGNLINGELFGRATDVSWCINYEDVCRHPSQIYAAIKNFTIFTILFSLRNKTFKKGTLFSMFIILYSSFRFIVEFWREPDSNIGLLIFNLSQGQIISVIMFLLGLILLKLVNQD